MAGTIFTKILRGEIPCHRVYEDGHLLAFLDVAPLSAGHTHIIPKYADGSGLGIGWQPGALDQQRARELAAAIAREVA